MLEIVPLDKIPVAEDVPLDNLMSVYKTCLDLQDACEFGDGVGLSAVQVGIAWKLFVVRYGNKFSYFVNCKYEPLVDPRLRTLQSIEGCLSLRKDDGSFRSFLVNRYPKIKVTGKSLVVGEYPVIQDIDLRLSDDRMTVVFQHEIDHQFGTERLISVIGEEKEIII